MRFFKTLLMMLFILTLFFPNLAISSTRECSRPQGSEYAEPPLIELNGQKCHVTYHGDEETPAICDETVMGFPIYLFF